MKTYDLWAKMIRGKVYTKEVAILRVTTISPLLTDGEFENLISLIQEVYV